MQTQGPGAPEDLLLPTVTLPALLATVAPSASATVSQQAPQASAPAVLQPVLNPVLSIIPNYTLPAGPVKIPLQLSVTPSPLTFSVAPLAPFLQLTLPADVLPATLLPQFTGIVPIVLPLSPTHVPSVLTNTTLAPTPVVHLPPPAQQPVTACSHSTGAARILHWELSLHNVTSPACGTQSPMSRHWLADVQGSIAGTTSVSALSSRHLRPHLPGSS